MGTPPYLSHVGVFLLSLQLPCFLSFPEKKNSDMRQAAPARIETTALTSRGSSRRTLEFMTPQQKLLLFWENMH